MYFTVAVILFVHIKISHQTGQKEQSRAEQSTLLVLEVLVLRTFCFYEKSERELHHVSPQFDRHALFCDPVRPEPRAARQGAVASNSQDMERRSF